MFSAKICFTHSTSPVAELHVVDYHTIGKSVNQKLCGAFVECDF